MSDICDRAGPNIENAVADSLAEIRRAPSLVPAGFCHYCGEVVPPSHLFCDAECRADHDYMTARKRAQGMT